MAVTGDRESEPQRQPISLCGPIDSMILSMADIYRWLTTKGESNQKESNHKQMIFSVLGNCNF